MEGLTTLGFEEILSNLSEENSSQQYAEIDALVERIVGRVLMTLCNSEEKGELRCTVIQKHLQNGFKKAVDAQTDREKNRVQAAQGTLNVQDTSNILIRGD